MRDFSVGPSSCHGTCEEGLLNETGTPRSLQSKSLLLSGPFLDHYYQSLPGVVEALDLHLRRVCKDAI